MRYSLMAPMVAPVVETILAVGTKRPLERGYTLVELLVVLVILALMSGIIVTSLPQKRGDADKSVRMVRQLTEGLSESAVLEGRPYGLSLEDGRLKLFKYDGGGWSLRPLPRETQTIDRIYMTLTVGYDFDYGEDEKGSELLFLGRDGTTKTTEKPPRPMIVFSPTGERTPFRLRLEDDGEAFVLETSGLSRLEVSRVQ